MVYGAEWNSVVIKVLGVNCPSDLVMGQYMLLVLYPYFPYILSRKSLIICRDVGDANSS